MTENHAQRPHGSASLWSRARRFFIAVWDAVKCFNEKDSWAIASHIALTMLMSLFPFFIVVTAIAGMFGSRDLANEASKLLFQIWPREVVAPISEDLQRIATSSNGGALTVGALFALYFASSGVDSLRIGLNRAYGEEESRSWLRLKLISIFYVILGAVALVIISVLVVVGPALMAAAMRYLPSFPKGPAVTVARYAIAAAIFVIALFALHDQLPAGRRRLSQILPGVVLTVFLWLVAGAGFGWYLETFPDRYVKLYAGLASAMIALIFLYFTGAIFIYGGEFNAALCRMRARRTSGGGDRENLSWSKPSGRPATHGR